ncbi:MAG: aminoacyl-histidine dipeptidase [Schaedlerella sp.]|nr:aminoacyl-histidine dipeptidase [Schaedlerella sp.]
MRILDNLQPAEVFHFFEEICAIPHTSFHEQELSDYCVKFAQDRGLFCRQDELGNVVIIAEATEGYEDVPAVILQGHLDMVGDKTQDCTLDLEKDGLELFVEGDLIGAKGTTLGADDGIAVAYALAVLDSKEISHPRLEVVLTVSEEVGLIGAAGIDLSECQAKRLINIDSEDEGVLTVGCAGGRRDYCVIPVQREEKEGLVCKLSIEGLLGGHSGIEIDRGRANAAVLMGRFMMLLEQNISCSIVELNSGVKENVIPKDSKAVILIEEEDLYILKNIAEVFNEKMAAEYGTADPDIRLSVEAEEIEKTMVLEDISAQKIMMSLNLMPNGIQAMSMDLPGLVESSLNLGTVELKEDTFEMAFSIRSSVVSAKEYMSDKIEYLTGMLGGTVEISGDYPSWPYAKESKLRDLCISVFKEQYGYEPKVELIHAGLECGILSDKIPGLDCVSFGPNLTAVHTPNERVSISSTARVWEYLKALLAAK